jgi:AcrR family transcriptional regulator
MASSLGRVRMRRPGTPGPRGGGVYVTELQRARLLDAAFAVVSEDGYRRMTARRVSGRAGVSNKTFYDLFTDREDCFLAAFDHAVDELAAVVLPAYEGEREWATAVRAGLGALLGFLDGEPALRRLVFVEALGAGPRVLERRARVLEDLGSVIDQGRAGMKAGRGLPALTAEGVVGAAFGVIHTRLFQESGWGGASRSGVERPAHPAKCALHTSDRGRRPIIRDRPAPPIVALLNELMAAIVLPYRPEFGRSPHNPWRTAMGALALAPSRAWFPGRRGNQTCRGAHPFFNPTNCRPISDRSHNRTTTKETR